MSQTDIFNLLTKYKGIKFTTKMIADNLGVVNMRSISVGCRKLSKYKLVKSEPTNNPMQTNEKYYWV